MSWFGFLLGSQSAPLFAAVICTAALGTPPAATLQTSATVLPQPPPLASMPPVVDPANLYSEAAAGHLSPAVADALPRVYVPNVLSGDVDVIDPATMQVVDHFPAGHNPQHVIPSWDLKTLWVASSVEGHRFPGSLVPIDPKTGKPGDIIRV